MSNADINFHIATQMRLNPVREGDVVLIAAGLVPFDLFGTTPLAIGQRKWGFANWAANNNLPDDPLQAAIATGYQPSE